MNRGPGFAPSQTPEQEPSPGTLRSVEQRLKRTLVANSRVLANETGKVSGRTEARTQDRLDRILWQLGMIESLKAEKIWDAAKEGVALEATEQASNLSAAEAATRLEAWTQQVLDPRQDEDPANVTLRGHAEDLFSKLIDEASYTLA